MRWVGALFAVSLIALAACGNDSGGAASAPDSTASPAEALTIRLVLREAPPPCDSSEAGAGGLVVPATDDEGAATCLVLGPVVADGTAISEAHVVSFEDDSDLFVSAQLDAAASARFDQLASEHLGERAAIALGDELISAPQLASDHYDGNIALGPLSEDVATALVSALHAGTAPDEAERAIASDRATQLCERDAATRAELDLSIVQATTAGEITLTMGANAVEPWKSLPDDHFVAVCSYLRPLPQGAATSECPDATPSRLAVSYLVDEDGRAMPDPRVERPGIVLCP